MAHWIGPGIFVHHDRDKEGKIINTRDILPGEELPKDIHKDLLNRLIEKGKASHKAPVSSAAASEADVLRAQLAEAKECMTKVDGLETQLAAATKTNEDLTAQLAQAQTTIEDLTAQLTGGKKK